MRLTHTTSVPRLSNPPFNAPDVPMRSNNENLSSGISVFAAVVDAGSFVAASEQLGMSPPGVSRAIARLEKRLKIRLFNRTTRAVSLTEEGRQFYEQVMPHLRGMEEAATASLGRKRFRKSIGTRLA